MPARRADSHRDPFNLSGHGHFDLGAYDAYFAGKLEDVELPQERLDTALAELPKVPAGAV